MAAKIVLGKGRYDGSTGCLAELHWLPIQQRIEFKIITLVHKSLHGLVPQYLVDLLTRLGRYNAEKDSTPTARLVS